MEELERYLYMELNKVFPSVVKYMGSKTEVLDLIELGMNELDRDYEYVCDLFAGSATLTAALRGKTNVISNDIQKYSSVFAKTYFENYDWKNLPSAEDISKIAEDRVNRFYDFFPGYREKFSYDKEFSVDELNEMEGEQRALIDSDIWKKFDNYYLFVKCYSGTYWSFEQCVWIDSFRFAIDQFKEDEGYYNLLLSCLMYAMAYNSQSTGHYAQYRIPEKDSSKDDILIYRRKNLRSFFTSKYDELKEFTSKKNKYSIKTYAVLDDECLDSVPEGSLIYADPPYCFVHYSRFYHVLETLVRYDYPEVRFKGRYRTDRYQSKYCIRTEVAGAFERLFTKIRDRKQDLILSYSNSDTNTITYKELIEVCCNSFNEGTSKSTIKDVLKKCEDFFANNERVCKLMDAVESKGFLYEIQLVKKPYNHSRMGRTDSKTIPVTEILIIAKRII